MQAISIDIEKLCHVWTHQERWLLHEAISTPCFKLQISISEDATDLKPPTEVSATIVSMPLLRALFDVYLGSTPVSASAKSSIAIGAYQL